MEETQGDLNKTSLLQLLHRIHTEPDPCGVLDVLQGQAQRHFYFKDGMLSAATSNVLNEVVGRLLLDDKIITKADYELSLGKAAAEKRRHGEVLISMGLITPADLGKFLSVQLQRRLWKAMGFIEANFVYRKAPCAPPGMTLEPAHPAYLILEGISHGFYPAQRLALDLKPLLDQPYKTAESTGRYRAADFRLNLQEIRFLRLFDGKRTIAEILETSDLLRHRAEALVLAFAITGIIKKTKAETAAPPETMIEAVPIEALTTAPAPVEATPSDRFNAERLFMQAKAALAKKDYLAAVDLFKEISALNPQEAEYKAYLAWTVFNKNLKNAYEANSILKDALKMNPDIPAAWHFLGMIYLLSGYPDAADKALRMALSKDPLLLEARVEVKLLEFKRTVRPPDDFSARRRYIDYFGYLEDPFGEPPEPRYFLDYPGVLAPLAAAIDAIGRREGHIIIQGMSGSGKTAAAFELLRRLSLSGNKVMCAFMLDPSKDKRILLRSINSEFLWAAQPATLKEDLLSLAMTVEHNRLHGGHTLIIIDNAHDLSDESLVLLGELGRHQYLQLLLLAAPAFTVRLKAPVLKELSARLTLRQTVAPLSRRDIPAYIEKRLSSAPRFGLAGVCASEVAFDEKAIARIHEMSGGTPALVNRLAARALTVVAGLDKSTVDAEIMQAVNAGIKGTP